MRVSKFQIAVFLTAISLMIWLAVPMFWAETAYWAYQPVTVPDVPPVKNQGWVENPIDTFILNQLEEKGLLPATQATKRALIRRAY